VCERWRWTFWTPFCNRDLFADCSLNLTLIVSFWKITFLVCCKCWKQTIISRSWNWTHLQFSTRSSNGCQCVLCNFQWFLFSIMSVTVRYLGTAFFGTHTRNWRCNFYALAYPVARALSCRPGICPVPTSTQPQGEYCCPCGQVHSAGGRVHPVQKWNSPQSPLYRCCCRGIKWPRAVFSYSWIKRS